MSLDDVLDHAPTREKIGQSGATCFSMRGLPLLSQGASFDGLATSENLWLSVKVYSSGGENALHTHTVEDHAFVVMQGKGTFYFGDGSTRTIIQFEGVMIPKGTPYRFEADTRENLVLLRVGGAQRKTQGDKNVRYHGIPRELDGTTIDIDGGEKNASDPKTGTPSQEIVRIPGRFFAES